MTLDLQGFAVASEPILALLTCVIKGVAVATVLSLNASVTKALPDSFATKRLVPVRSSFACTGLVSWNETYLNALVTKDLLDVSVTSVLVGAFLAPVLLVVVRIWTEDSFATAMTGLRELLVILK